MSNKTQPEAGFLDSGVKEVLFKEIKDFGGWRRKRTIRY